MRKKLIRIFSVMVLGSWLIASAAGVQPAGAAPPRQDNMPELVYGQTVDGQIASDQPSAFYEFSAQAGDVVTITMIVTEGDLDPFLVLNDANRNPLATDDSSGGGVNARLTFVIPLAGKYIIQATHSGGLAPEAGGTFSLNLTAAVDGLPATQPVATPEPPVSESDIPTIQGDSTRLVKLQPGATVRDTLDRQTALRFYWFEAQQGDRITITPEELADFQPLVVLYSASFVEQARADPGAAFQAIIPTGGLYFLSVSLPDTSSAGGAYGFGFDTSGNPATEGNFTDITYNQNQRGALDSAIPSVTYRFRGTAGDAITVTMSRVGGDLNSYLYLLDGDGQLLYEDNDSGGDNGDARIEFTLPEDGTYLIVATRQGQAQGTTSGSYLLELLSDSPPPPEIETVAPTLPPEYADFAEISYGSSVEDELSNAKFMDVYVFLGTEGDAITIEMTSLNADVANGLDPLLILLDDGRIPLADNDDIVDGVERDSRIQFTLPRTAYYAIVATRFEQEAGTTSGPYTLTLHGPSDAVSEPAANLAEAAPIDQLAPIPLAAGTPVQATFDAGASVYTFDARSGSLVDVALTTDPGQDSVIILTDENLNEILSSGTGALTGITIPKTGSYLVILTPRFGPVDALGGNYILALTQSGEQPNAPAAAPGPQALTYGDVVNGTIDDEIISQLYTFSGAAGDHVRITMEATPGSNLDCYLELQSSDGVIVDANDDIDAGIVRDSQIVADLPADGTYLIIASRYVGADAEPTTGTFRLSLERVDETTAGTTSLTIPLIYGQTEIGEINDNQYLLFYAFDGTAGDVVTVEIDNLTGNLDSVLHLYQSVGNQWLEIANNDDSSSGGTYEALLRDIVLPQTGKYLIAVNRYGLDRENTYGTFAITLTRTS